MILSAILLIAVVALVLVLVSLARQQGEDRSIESYRRALDTLEHLSDDSIRERSGLSQLRAPRPREDGQPLIFDDLGRARNEISSAIPAGRRGPDWAMHRMENHHSTRTVPWVVAAGAAVSLLILVIIGTSLASSRHHGTSTSTSSITEKHSKHGKARASQHAETSVTALPTKFEPLAGSDGSTYRPPANSYVLEVKVTAPCWTELVNPTTGQTAFAAIVNPGVPQRFKLSGETRLSLSAPSGVSVRLDSEAVVMPPLAVPLVLTFNPAA
ncbi:MAG: hypothetical protein WCO31_03245 [Actinomycetes bacterium]